MSVIHIMTTGGKSMNTTKPITDSNLISEVLSIYEVGSKNHLLIAYALNTGLRVSDILQTKVKESKNGFWIGREKKTNKEKTLVLSNNLRVLIMDYVNANKLNDSDYLFHNQYNKGKPISRQAVDKVIRHAGEMVGLTLSAHSLRKTFGYMAYKTKQYDLAELQFLFNHSSSKITLRYIGVTQESINDKMKNFNIGI